MSSQKLFNYIVDNIALINPFIKKNMLYCRQRYTLLKNNEFDFYIAHGL